MQPRARLVSVDVPGLDLILGGGVPVVQRHPDANESAVLLLRGPPGSGKTVLGTQLAGALARALGSGMDVAYGCIELLPAELFAQHDGLKPPDRPDHTTILPERIITPPFPADARAVQAGHQCRIYADLLRLDPGEEQAGIEGAVERLLDLVTGAGGNPRVVVIDSLSDGYNLGSTAPRIIADTLSKLAVAKGMVFILLEETIDSRPSVWSFAADLVMELRQSNEQGAYKQPRTINVTKNRFGRADPGPHRASITQAERYTIWPEPSAYLSAPLLMVRKRRTETKWGIQSLDANPVEWLQLRDQTIAVMGTDPIAVNQLAYSIARPNAGEIELSVNISDTKSPATTKISDPYTSGAGLLASIVPSVLDPLATSVLARVIIGDMRSLRLFPGREDIMRSLMVLSALLHKATVPLILFDSSMPQNTYLQTPGGSQLPLIADFADVQIIGWYSSQQVPSERVTATQGGKSIPLQGKL